MLGDQANFFALNEVTTDEQVMYLQEVVTGEIMVNGVHFMTINGK